jgi:hypothetical protein
VQLGGVVEDLALEHLELGPGIETEPVAQRGPHGLEGGEGVRLAPAAVESDDQVGPQALAEGVGGGERLQLAHELGVAAEGQLGLDAALRRRQPQLGQPHHGRPEGAEVDQVGQRLAPPQAEGPHQRGRRRLGSARPQRGTPLAHELLEAVGVDPVGVGLQHVARRPADQPGAGVAGHQLAQPRGVRADHADRGGRGGVAVPQRLDEGIGRDDLVGAQRQRRQHGPRFRATHGQRHPVSDDLEGPQHPELHR